MKSENMSTMRRKVIAEGKGEREAAKAASNQTSSIDDLSKTLQDIQTQGEITSEVIEDKGNQIIDSIDKVESRVSDVVEGSELAAEASERTTTAVKDNTEVANRISDKLTKLSELLSEKLGVSASAGPRPDSPAVVIPESLPDSEFPMPVVIPPVLPQPENNDPNDSVFPPVVPTHEDNSESGRQDEKEKKENKDLFKELLKTTKTGFKASLGVTDKIAGMLFKYTVSALAESAKLAGMLFAIVLTIDVIRAHFKYWSDKFSTDFDTFSEEAGIWGSTLASIFGTLENIKKFWEAGDWGGLTIAIVSGVGKVLYNLGEIIQLGMAKVTAAILSIIPGMDGAALSVEGAALEGFQERTGNALSKDDQDTVARYQSSKIEDGENIYDKYQNARTWLKNKISGDTNIGDHVSDEERDAERDKLKAMNPEERIEVLKKSNEARAAIIRFEKYMDDVDPDNKQSVATMDKAYNKLKDQVSDSDIAKAGTTKKELDSRMDSVKAKYEKMKGIEAAPAPVSESDDAKKVNAIEKSKAESVSSGAVAPGASVGNLINTTNMVNNSKVVNNHAPLTSTQAPGVYGATRVN